MAFLLRESRLGSTIRRAALLPFLRRFEPLRVDHLTDAEAKRQLPYGVALAIGLVLGSLVPRVASLGGVR